jgi:hypothetical protein
MVKDIRKLLESNDANIAHAKNKVEKGIDEIVADLGSVWAKSSSVEGYLYALSEELIMAGKDTKEVTRAQESLRVFRQEIAKMRSNQGRPHLAKKYLGRIR